MIEKNAKFSDEVNEMLLKVPPRVAILWIIVTLVISSLTFGLGRLIRYPQTHTYNVRIKDTYLSDSTHRFVPYIIIPTDMTKKILPEQNIKIILEDYKIINAKICIFDTYNDSLSYAFLDFPLGNDNLSIDFSADAHIETGTQRLFDRLINSVLNCSL